MTRPLADASNSDHHLSSQPGPTWNGAAPSHHRKPPPQPKTTTTMYHRPTPTAPKATRSCRSTGRRVQSRPWDSVAGTFAGTPDPLRSHRDRIAPPLRYSSRWANNCAPAFLGLSDSSPRPCSNSIPGTQLASPNSGSLLSSPSRSSFFLLPRAHPALEVTSHLSPPSERATRANSQGISALEGRTLSPRP